METDVIKIKCPSCGAVLAVRKSPGIERKRLTCPVCKENAPYAAYRPIVDKRADEHTEYPGKTEPSVGSEEQTRFKVTENYTLGQLTRLSANAESFRLKPGRNIIGRKADASTADFQLSTADCRRLSREHLVVEVKKIPEKGFVHFVSLYKEHCNATYINDERLEYGDSIVLQHGDLLRLPDVSIKFELPNDDQTDI